jgi:hypothetical protein
MTFIFHITHINNLRKILKSGQLWCDNEKIKRGLEVKGIAHDHIKLRRQRRRVTAGKQEFVADYVPFYFAERSPMLCAIHNGRIENYKDEQVPVIHLFSSVEKVVAANLPFVFTDGQAEMATSRFFDDINQLDEIDWEIMRDKMWRDTAEDGDRKRRRQAEFLVYNNFPVSLIGGIGVISENIRKQVEEILNEMKVKMPVVVKRHWYY